MLHESKNMQLPGMAVRKAAKVELADDWSELLRSKELNHWMMARQEDDQRTRIVQDLMLRTMDFLTRIIAPVHGHRGVARSYVCPRCRRFPLGDFHLVGFDETREHTW